MVYERELLCESHRGRVRDAAAVIRDVLSI